MPVALELWILRADQPEPCLMNQRCRLECLASSFVGHHTSGEPTQLIVHDRKQLLSGLGVAAANRVQNPRYVAHGRTLSDYTRAKALPMRSGSHQTTIGSICQKGTVLPP